MKTASNKEGFRTSRNDDNGSALPQGPEAPSTQILPAPFSKTMSDQDICTEWGVTVSFINQHSREMKPYKWHPRRYFRKFVDEFFLKRATAKASLAECRVERGMTDKKLDPLMVDFIEIRNSVAWRKKHGLPLRAKKRS